MFAALKQKLLGAKQKHAAVGQSQHWKQHPALRDCLGSMRGLCTVAPMDLHEALVAAVNIALTEVNWNQTVQIPDDFLTQTVYIVWNDPLLPVLRTDREILLQNPEPVTAVAPQTFLISETMDRIVHFHQGTIRLYDLT